jgi:PTH1 family peptidyl-tRNA hydrolase
VKLIVGLGNPGPSYAKTRHNVGFMVVDQLLERHAKGAVPKARFQALTAEAEVKGERAILVKPTTFMNRSGLSVGEAIRFFKLDAVQDLLVVVDDLYLPVGKIRLKPGGGTGGHNGLDDIHRALGRDDYPRLGVGVGVGPSGGRPPMIEQADFVLSRFTQEEQVDLAPAISRAADAAETFVSRGLDAAMNAYNADPRPAKPPRNEANPTPPGGGAGAVSKERIIENQPDEGARKGGRE